MNKRRKIILGAIIIAVGIIASRYATKVQRAQPSPTMPGYTYYNMLSEVQFELPNDYKPEDVTYPAGVALYENLSDEFKRTKSETDFLKSGGIYVKIARQIPGTKEMFEAFMKQDFEIKLKQLGKTFTSEMFVTDQGYDAFRTTVTNPGSEVHVVVNTPIAFWLTAQSDTPAFKRVYQSFKPFKADEVVDERQAVSVFESFITNLKDQDYAAAGNKMSLTLRNEFPADLLRSTFNSAQPRLNRPLHVFSLQTNGDKVAIRSTLEDAAKGQFAFMDARLVKTAGEWQMDRFSFDADTAGLPFEQAIANVKKEVKKDDFLKK